MVCLARLYALRQRSLEPKQGNYRSMRLSNVGFFYILNDWILGNKEFSCYLYKNYRKPKKKTLPHRSRSSALHATILSRRTSLREGTASMFPKVPQERPEPEGLQSCFIVLLSQRRI